MMAGRHPDASGIHDAVCTATVAGLDRPADGGPERLQNEGHLEIPRPVPERIRVAGVVGPRQGPSKPYGGCGQTRGANPVQTICNPESRVMTSGVNIGKADGAAARGRVHARPRGADMNGKPGPDDVGHDGGERVLALERAVHGEALAVETVGGDEAPTDRDIAGVGRPETGPGLGGDRLDADENREQREDRERAQDRNKSPARESRDHHTTLRFERNPVVKPGTYKSHRTPKPNGTGTTDPGRPWTSGPSGSSTWP